MKFGPFKEGLDILAKHIDAEDVNAVYAEHDQIWIGADEDLTDPTQSSISTEEVERLKELGWRVDEESWSCYT
jgi:hypothetical protein